MSSLTTCTICETPSTSHCARCGLVTYCSKAHQKEDWPSHKLLCHAAANFKNDSHPSHRHLRAIHFPVNAEKPEFIWVSFQGVNKSKHGFAADKVSTAEIDDLCSTSAELQGLPKKKPSLYPEYAARVLGSEGGPKVIRKVELWARDEFMSDGSLPNKAMVHATRPYLDTTPRVIDWRGPIVALAMEGADPKVMHYVDADLDHFRIIIENTLWKKHETEGREMKFYSEDGSKELKWEEVKDKIQESPLALEALGILTKDDPVAQMRFKALGLL